MATSQNTVVPPLPSTTSQPSGSPNRSLSPARTAPTTLLDRRLAVRRAHHGACRRRRAASSCSGRTLEGPHPNRPSAGSSSRGDAQRGGGAQRVTVTACQAVCTAPKGLPCVTWFRTSGVRTPVRHRRVGHAGRRRQGQGAAGPGRGRHRVRRRRARLPDARAHRRGRRRRLPRSEEPPLHAGRRAARAEGGDRPKTKRDSGFDCTASQVLVTNGGKHAVYTAFAALCDPGRRGDLPGAVLDDLPGGDHARRRRAEGHRDDRGDRLPGHRRPARGGLHRAHQGAAVRQPRQPVRRGVPAGAGGRDRPVGRRARRVGDHRRDLRAPHVRPARVHVDAGARARHRRPVHRRQRRRQDVRHDRLARRLDDRPARRHQGGDELPEPRHVERLQRRPARRARRGRAATSRRWR